jgi:perosamine synthetase
MIPVNRPLIQQEDIDAVVTVLKEGNISGDTQIIRDCEKRIGEILGTNNVILVNSGTSALDLAIESLDIKERQECILPAFTIMSSVNQLIRKRARIHLIDSDKENWSMNLDEVRNKVSKKTKLVLPVHIYGYPLDLSGLIEMSKEMNFLVLEDAAESFGSRIHKKAIGTFGSAGIYSFYANKIITGGEGGAIVTDNDQIAERARKYRNLNFSSIRFVHEGIGWNARMSSLSAALIMSQLDRLEKLLTTKLEIGNRYRKGLKDHPWFIHPKESNGNALNSYWVYGIVLNSETKMNAQSLQETLLARYGIQTRRFFCPIHLQPFIKRHDVEYSDLSVSEWLWERGIYLPCGLGNTNYEIDQVIESLWDLV